MTFCSRKSGVLRSANKTQRKCISWKYIQRRYQKRLFIMQHHVVSVLYMLTQIENNMTQLSIHKDSYN